MYLLTVVGNIILWYSIIAFSLKVLIPLIGIGLYIYYIIGMDTINAFLQGAMSAL